MFELAIMTAIIIAFAELIKKIKMLSPMFIPILNIVSGIVLSMAYFEKDFYDILFQGVVLGLTSTGIYSSLKSILRSTLIRLQH